MERQERERVERQPSVADIPDEELLRRAVVCDGVGRRKMPRWIRTMERFTLGSTYAHQLCQRFGVDPYETVRR